MISKGFFPWKHKGCFWKENLRNTLCVSFMFPIDRFFVFLKVYLWETCFLCFKQRKKHLSCFKKINFEEKQKIYLWETWKKHIMCFSDFSFRNTFCVSVGKILWKSQNVSLNGFFQGKHHPGPAVCCEYCIKISCRSSNHRDLPERATAKHGIYKPPLFIPGTNHSQTKTHLRVCCKR